MFEAVIDDASKILIEILANSALSYFILTIGQLNLFKYFKKKLLILSFGFLQPTIILSGRKARFRACPNIKVST